METDRLSRMAKTLGRRLSRRAAVRGGGVGVGAAALALVARAAPAQARQATPAAEGADPGWYAAIRRARLAEGASSEEVLGIVRETFLPLVTTVPGFVAYYVVDTGQGEHVTISVFADAAGPEESNRRSAEWAPRALAGLIAGSPEVVADGEVGVYAEATEPPATPEA